ncbi:MAG: hypothetical protein WAN47_09535 [Nitrosotalea sp.]
MVFNPFDKTKTDGTGKPNPRQIRDKKFICTLEKIEVDGMKMAEKRRAYKEWAYAIAHKYNLTRTDFTVDENTYGLYYPIE